MNEVVQYVLVVVIVGAAVVAVIRAIVLMLREQKTVLAACTGCKLQEYCQKSKKNSAKKCADKVAQVKNHQ